MMILVSLGQVHVLKELMILTWLKVTQDEETRTMQPGIAVNWRACEAIDNPKSLMDQQYKRLTIKITFLLTLWVSGWLSPLAIASDTDLLEQLSVLPTFIDVALAPDGKKMATIVQRQGRFGVLVQDTKTLNVLAWLEPTRFEAAGVNWASNERIIIDIGRRESYAEQLQVFGELYAVNYDGTRGDFLFGIRAADNRQGSRTRTREGQRAWGQLIDPLPRDSKHMLVSSEPMSGDRSEIPTVVRVNVKNGKVKELIRSPIQQPFYLTDESGEVRWLSSPILITIAKHFTASPAAGIGLS